MGLIFNSGEMWNCVSWCRKSSYSLLRFSLTYAAISFCSLEWDELWAEHILSRYFWQKLWAIFSIHKWTLLLCAPKPLSIFAIVLPLLPRSYNTFCGIAMLSLYGGLKKTYRWCFFFSIFFLSMHYNHHHHQFYVPHHPPPGVKILLKEFVNFSLKLLNTSTIPSI